MVHSVFKHCILLDVVLFYLLVDLGPEIVVVSTPTDPVGIALAE